MSFNKREYNRLQRAAKYASRRAAGLCGDCGVPIDKYAKCLECRIKTNIRGKACRRPRFANTKKVCVCGCGKEFLVRNSKHKFATPHCKWRVFAREYSINKWRRYRSVGACGQCGIPCKNFTRCLRCRLYARLRRVVRARAAA